MRVLVCGSRTWANYSAILNRLVQFEPDTVIVHGGAHGADEMAGRAARELGLTEEVHPADWEQYGPKVAGLIRNVEMLESGVDLVLAFWRDDSRGTAHTMAGAKKRRIPLEVHVWPS